MAPEPLVAPERSIRVGERPAALQLHLGCGHSRIAGWVNCDLYPNPNVDAAFDCQKDWPFADSSAGVIYASHLLEHLRDPWAFFQEAHRVLIPNGTMTLRLPYGGHRAAYWDLTHIRPWFAENFCFLQPGYAKAVGNPQSEFWKWPFAISSVDMRISGKFAKWMRWPPVRRWILHYGENVDNFCEELWVNLWALKSPEAIEQYQQDHPHANAVITRWVMYRHHLERRGEMRMGEIADLVWLEQNYAVNGFHSNMG